MLLYFAYGSNLHPLRLAARAPSCALVGTARLDEHVLRFHKRGTDDSAKADAVRTGDPTDRVLGALFRIDPRDKPGLDVAETLGCGYDEHRISVRGEDGPLQVFTYLADPLHIDPTLDPYTWYREYVLLGARYHGMPADYIETIATWPAVPDPDPARAARHEARLRAMRGGD